MRNIQINPETGDLAIVAGNLGIVTEAAAIAQAIRCRLLLFLGEWFLDTRQGVPYFQRVLVKNPDLPLVASTVRTAILGTPGVARLTQYSQAYDSATRRLTVAFTAVTDDGDEISDSEVLGA